MKTKALTERRAQLLDEMESILKNAETESRALTEEECADMDTKRTEITNIDQTITAMEETRTLSDFTSTASNTKEEKRALDEKNFIAYCRGEVRALDAGSNGAIIPEHIAAKIIETVKEISPIYNLVTTYNVGGDLVFPLWTDTSKAAYAAELTELTEGTGAFTSVKLQNHIIGKLTLISRSLMNRSDFDVLNFIVRKIAEAMVEFLERELIVGTTGKMEGVLSAANGITAASATAITADELIDLQMSIPQVYQSNACWIMHKSTLAAIRKLKTANNEYLLNPDITSPFGWSILGKHVYITESMPAPAAGKKAIVYGDMSGLYLKFAQNMEIQILYEKYATQHGIGVCAWTECDSKIVEPQKIRLLTMKASA